MAASSNIISLAGPVDGKSWMHNFKRLIWKALTWGVLDEARVRETHSNSRSPPTP